MVHLALVVIARDEAPRIARLLHSVAPWVDDMLVLDTGSTDATAAIARGCGARVEHAPWCDDFSAARNAALDHAGAGWHLVLDADEWLVDGGPSLRQLCKQPADFVGALRLDDHGAAAGVVHSWLSRLLPGRVRYAGRVHEQPQHALPVRRLPLVVGHDGYAAERLAAKRGRNRRLIQADLARVPDDAYLWYQLGKDFGAHEEHGAAAQAYARAAALGGPGAPWAADLCTRRLYTLKKTGAHAQAWALAQHHLADFEGSPDFFFALGDLMLDWAAEQAGADAPEKLDLARAAWQRCLEIGERPDQSGSVQGRGSYLAAHNLAVICEVLGQRDEAAAWRERHPAPAV